MLHRCVTCTIGSQKSSVQFISLFVFCIFHIVWVVPADIVYIFVVVFRMTVKPPALF